MKKLKQISVFLLILIVFVGCQPSSDSGDDASGYTIGGNISGLFSSIELQLNGSDTLTVSSNGAFLFSSSIEEGATYEVSVSTQPTGPIQNCTVTNGSGTATNNVSNISITCVIKLVFMAYDGTNNGLWLSYGSADDAVNVKNMSSFYESSDLVPRVVELGDSVYFGADDGTTGIELWKSDGTASGTEVVKDMDTHSSGYSRPSYLTVALNKIFFVTEGDGNAWDLWASDGTESGTSLMADVDANAGFFYGTEVNGKLFFSVDTPVANGDELWSSDGTVSGTQKVKDGYATNPYQLVSYNNSLYFSGNTSGSGYQLWKSDGIESGTVVVKDENPGDLTVSGNLMFFYDNSYTDLWTSDGTDAGTSSLTSFGGGGTAVIELTDVNGVLFFRADDGSTGDELWKSDGTVSGTSIVKDINSGGGNSSPQKLTNVNGTLFFVATDGSNGYELWKSDGTESGTTMVKDITSGSSGSSFKYFENRGNLLFFCADDGTHGMERWISDGTEAGTYMLGDINEGAGDGCVSYLGG